VGLARLEASGLGKSLDADELRKRERAFLGTFADYPLFWGMEACPELVRMPPGRSGSPLAGLHVEGANRLTWHRGFVAGVTCPTAEWLRHGAEVRRRNPVEWVTLARCEAVPRDAWYVGLPALRGLRDVRLFGFPDPDRGGELVTWLRGWLPGTRVEWSPV
jgi:hypothetical protein